MNHFCFITDRYPLPGSQDAPVFVQRLVRALANKGRRCTVICPVDAGLQGVNPVGLKQRVLERTEKGGVIELFHPPYVGFHQRIPGSVAKRLSQVTFTEAVRQSVQELGTCPDLFYGYAISPAGLAAARLGRSLGRPAFASCGDSVPWADIQRGYVRRELASLAGIITASSCDRIELASRGVAALEAIGVFPGGVDPEHFYPRCRSEARQRLGIPEGLFVAAYAGPFTESGGIATAVRAIERTPGIYGIYAGTGPVAPSSPKTLLACQLDPSELPWFFSAANVLLLPARQEVCGVIAESLACGLPVITSSQAFSSDWLDERCSTLVDPDRFDDICAALARVHHDASLQRQQAACAWSRGRKLSLNARARKIAEFLESRADKWHQLHATDRACSGLPAPDVR